MFAKSVQCGFFAAHPEVIATGCQLSQEALLSSDDYLRYFFQAATRSSGRSTTSDGASATRLPSLSAAHWAASVLLEDHQISYTTSDALIDDYFAIHPEQLPAAITASDLREASDVLTADEARALKTLTAKLPADHSIPLTGYVELNAAAQAKLDDAREQSSKARNRITAMPYKLALPMLARRVVYKSLNLQDAEFRAATRCETQTIPDVLGVDISD